jgi:hypothetical protein
MDFYVKPKEQDQEQGQQKQIAGKVEPSSWASSAQDKRQLVSRPHETISTKRLPPLVVVGILLLPIVAGLAGVLLYKYYSTSTLPASQQGPPSPGSPKSSPDHGADRQEQVSETSLRQAVEDYYEAVDREDWSYTYQNLDSQTRAMFTEEEWYRKNQWFADNESLELSSLNVNVDLSSSGTIAAVTVDRTFKDGTSIVRDTFFVYEDGSWKHRFGEGEIDTFMPEAAYAEFVAAQQRSSLDAGLPADEEAAVEEAVRGHYVAIGAGNFEEAYSYFGPTFRNRVDQESWVSSEESYQITNSTVNSVEVTYVDETTATATVDISFQDNTGTPRFLITWNLVKEDGQWKLDSQASGKKVG